MIATCSPLLQIALLTALTACGGRTGLDSPERPCLALSADCDHDPTNGCEADLGTDADNCGACGVACAAGLSCADRVCVPGDTLVQLDSMVSTQFVRTADGRVLVWGANEDGKGDPKSDDAFIVEPRLLDLPEPVVEVRTSRITTCARGASGRVWCWGPWVHIPGAAPGEASHGFVAVAGVSGAKALMVSHEGHCVFDALRRGLCWSANVSRELSTGAGHDVIVPLPAAVEMSAVEGNLVTLLPGVAAIEGGPVRTWGYGGALGWGASGHSGSALIPQVVPGLEDPVRVEGGSISYCASLRDGRVYCWGQEILPFETAFAPFLAFERGPYKKIAVSESLCALDMKGRVECFDPRDSDAQRDGIVDISSGSSSVCLLTRDQRVLCKGDNSEGQQGHGSVGGKVHELTEVSIPALP